MHLGWPSRHWRSLAITMALAAVVGGCASPSGSGTPSPAATVSGAPSPSYIVAASPTAPVAAPSTAAPSPSGSASPSAAAIQLTGTYEASLDITTTSSTGKIHTKIHQTGSVTASRAADGTLTGTATYTYRKDYSIGGPGCKLAWSTGDVTWDTAVTGTWEANADGSVAVSLLPAARQGPGIPEDYLCLGNITEHPVSVPYGGTLVNGIFDVRQDYMPAGTNFSWATWHLESTRG